MKSHKQIITTMRPTINQVVQAVVVCVLVVFVSACATTGGNAEKNDRSRVARINCSANTGTTGQQVNDNSKLERENTDCLPLGVIEIYENSPVEQEIRDEFNQAVVLLNQENYTEAIKLLKAVSGKTNKFSAPFINLGIAYSRIGDYENAENNLKKALEVSHLHPVAKNELGLIYRKTGRYDEARKIYETLLNLYPDFLPAKKNLGVLCDIYIQDLNCALRNYDEYLRAEPNDEKVKIWIADVKSRM
jgi:tetratricopeptide (TPR) repeat protein